MIYLVEDDPQLQKVLTRALERAGYSCRLAARKNRTLEGLPSFRPSLVLLDLDVRGLDGFEVCRRFRESEEMREVPIFLLSADGE